MRSKLIEINIWVCHSWYPYLYRFHSHQHRDTITAKKIEMKLNEWEKKFEKKVFFFLSLRERRASNDEIYNRALQRHTRAVVVFRWVSCSRTSDHAPQKLPAKIRLFILVAQRHHGTHCQHQSSATERSRHFKCNDSQPHYCPNVGTASSRGTMKNGKNNGTEELMMRPSGWVTSFSVYSSKNYRIYTPIVFRRY